MKFIKTIKSFLAKSKTKIAGALLVGLTYSPTAFAAQDPFATAGEQAKEFGDKMQMFGLIFAAAFIIVLAVIYMFPFKTAQEWVKKHLAGLIIGVLGIGLGASFIAWLIQISQ